MNVKTIIVGTIIAVLVIIGILLLFNPFLIRDVEPIKKSLDNDNTPDDDINKNFPEPVTVTMQDLSKNLYSFTNKEILVTGALIKNCEEPPLPRNFPLDIQTVEGCRFMLKSSEYSILLGNVDYNVPEGDYIFRGVLRKEGCEHVPSNVVCAPIYYITVLTTIPILGDYVTVEELSQNPATFLGKEVTVEGTLLAVCDQTLMDVGQNETQEDCLTLLRLLSDNNSGVWVKVPVRLPIHNFPPVFGHYIISGVFVEEKCKNIAPDELCYTRYINVSSFFPID